jgi:hypothetical protein
VGNFKVRDLMVTLVPNGECTEGSRTCKGCTSSIKPEFVEEIVLCNGTLPPENLSMSELQQLRADLDKALQMVDDVIKAAANKT